MLPRRLRLTKRRDFREVTRKGRVTSNEYLVVYVQPVRREELRAGFSMMKRYGNAVQRNRAKRLLRHAFAEAVAASGSDRLSRKGLGLRMVAIGKHRLREAPFVEIRDFIKRALERGADEAEEGGSGAC